MFAGSFFCPSRKDLTRSKRSGLRGCVVVVALHDEDLAAARRGKDGYWHNDKSVETWADKCEALRDFEGQNLLIVEQEHGQMGRFGTLPCLRNEGRNVRPKVGAQRDRAVGKSIAGRSIGGIAMLAPICNCVSGARSLANTSGPAKACGQIDPAVRYMSPCTTILQPSPSPIYRRQ